MSKRGRARLLPSRIPAPRLSSSFTLPRLPTCPTKKAGELSLSRLDFNLSSALAAEVANAVCVCGGGGKIAALFVLLAMAAVSVLGLDDGLGANP